MSSESSFGSEHSRVQQVSGNSGPAADDVFEQRNSLTVGLYGLLYTISKEKRTTPFFFVALKLSMDFLQLFLLIINPQYGWSLPYKSKAWQIVSFIQLNTFMSERGKPFFLTTMYIMVGVLMCMVLLCVWVAWSFQQNSFDHIWPIKVLRVYSSVFFNLFDIASLTVFLIALDCQYFDTDATFINQEFGDACWALPNLAHVSISAFSLIVFVVMASLMIMAEMELNPVSRNYLAVTHSRVDTQGFLIKVLMTCISTFVTNLRWMSVLQCALALVLLWSYLYWEPFQHGVMNQIRVGSYAAVLWCASLLIFLKHLPGVDAQDGNAVVSWEKSLTQAMWLGLGPAFVLGALASWVRLYYLQVVVPRRFRRAGPDDKLTQVYRFTDPRQVEIVARCVRKWVDEDTLQPEAIKTAEVVIKAGVAMLPNNCFMTILNSSFLIEVVGSYHSGYTQLQAAKKQDPSALERFAILCREQEHTQKVSGAQSGVAAVDLVSYVEFKRNQALVLRTHKEALLSMRGFWAMLMSTKVSFIMLSKAIARIELCVRQAERVYRHVLQKHPNNVKLLRLYAKFLQDLKQDPWAAAKWSSEAEKLELEEETNKEADVFGVFEDEALGISSCLNDKLSIILINAHCEIQMVNKATWAMFGYRKNELRGKNVSILIPAPFADHHNGYVKTYLSTGRKTLLDRSTDLIALHKNKSVFPIKLTVHLVSGRDEDSIFMGIIEAVPHEEGKAKAWVLANGTIASVDAAFSDWFGYRANELMGNSISTLIEEASTLDAHLRTARQPVVKQVSRAPSQSHIVTGTGSTWAPWGHGMGSPRPHKPPVHGMQRVAQFLRQALGQGPASPTLPDDLHKGLADTAPRHASVPRTSAISRNSLSFGPSVMPAPAPSGDKARARRRSTFLLSHHFQHSLLPVSGNAQSNHSLGQGSDRGLPGQEVGAGEGGNNTRMEEAFCIANCHVDHKFTDKVKVHISVRLGAVGTQHFHELSFQRVKAKLNVFDSRLFFAADRAGRVAFVSEELAAALGSSVASLMGGNAAHMVDMLMPEPFSQLHHAWLEASTVDPLPFGPPPSLSCRSGLSTCLLNHNPAGPKLLPFKLEMKRKEAGGDPLHTVSLLSTSLDTALDERRLKLRVNTDGYVTSVGKSGIHLFGFEPQELLGCHLTTFLDILRPSGMANAGAPVRPRPAASPAPAAAELAGPTSPDSWHHPPASPHRPAYSDLSILLELAQRAMAQPGLSWRVGVTPPLEQCDIAHLGPVGQAMLQQHTRPAAMTLAMHLPQRESFAPKPMVVSALKPVGPSTKPSQPSPAPSWPAPPQPPRPPASGFAIQVSSIRPTQPLASGDKATAAWASDSAPGGPAAPTALGPYGGVLRGRLVDLGAAVPSTPPDAWAPQRNRAGPGAAAEAADLPPWEVVPAAAAADGAAAPGSQARADPGGGCDGSAVQSGNGGHGGGAPGSEEEPGQTAGIGGHGGHEREPGSEPGQAESRLAVMGQTNTQRQAWMSHIHELRGSDSEDLPDAPQPATQGLVPAGLDRASHQPTAQAEQPSHWQGQVNNLGSSRLGDETGAASVPTAFTELHCLQHAQSLLSGTSRSTPCGADPPARAVSFQPRQLDQAAGEAASRTGIGRQVSLRAAPSLRRNLSLNPTRSVPPALLLAAAQAAAAPVPNPVPDPFNTNQPRDSGGLASCLSAGYPEGGRSAEEEAAVEGDLSQAALGALRDMEFEVELWRADLLTGVLELDAEGLVVNTDANPLCSAGLIFGSTPTTLMGSHISQLLALERRVTASDLFHALPQTITVDRGRAGGASLRGSMKRRETKSSKVGVEHRLHCLHLDGREIDVSCRAVQKQGDGQHAFIVLHVPTPFCGRRDFREWLMAEAEQRQQLALEVVANEIAFPNKGNYGTSHCQAELAFLDMSSRSPQHHPAQPPSIPPQRPAQHPTPPPPPQTLQPNLSSSEVQPAQWSAVTATAPTVPPLNLASLLLQGGPASARHAAGLHSRQGTPSATRLGHPSPTWAELEMLQQLRGSNSNTAAPQLPSHTAGRGEVEQTSMYSQQLPGLQVHSATVAAAVHKTGTVQSTDAGNVNLTARSVALELVPTHRTQPEAAATGLGTVPGPLAQPRLEVQLGAWQAGRQGTVDAVEEANVRRSVTWEGHSTLAALGPIEPKGACAGAGTAISRTAAWVVSGGTTLDVESAGLAAEQAPACLPVEYHEVSGRPLAKVDNLYTASGTAGYPAIVTTQQTVQHPVVTAADLGVLLQTSCMDEVKMSGAAHSANSPTSSAGQLNEWRHQGASIKAEYGTDRPNSPRQGRNCESESGGHTSEDGHEQKPTWWHGQVADVAEEAGAAFSDYVRGKRYRKLAKLLGGVQAQRVLRRFRLHTLACVATLFVVHLIAFIVMVVLLNRMQESVVDLNAVAWAAKKVQESCIRVQHMDLMFAGHTVPGVRGLQNATQEIGESMEDLDVIMPELKFLHSGVYFGFSTSRSLPSAFGLLDIWEGGHLVETQYLDSNPITVTNVTTNLWDLGNDFIGRVQKLQHNAAAINASGRRLSDTADYLFIMANGMDSVWGGYQKTLSSFVELTVRNSDRMNMVHLVVLGVEGILLTWASVIYMWRMAQQVDNQRYAMYNIFLSVPLGLVRSLVVKPVVLNDEDDDDDDAIEATLDPAAPDVADAGLSAAAVAQAAGQGRSTAATAVSAVRKGLPDPLTGLQHLGSPRTGLGDVGQGSMRLRAGAAQVDGRGRGKEPGAWSWSKGRQAWGSSGWRSMFKTTSSFLMGPSGASKVHPSTRRSLQRSYNAALWLVWPYVLWGVLVVALNAVRYDSLTSMSTPISLLNVVDIAMIRFHRCHLSCVQYVFQAPSSSPAQRQVLWQSLATEVVLLKEEWEVMVNGNKALTPTQLAESPHFNLAVAGVATPGSEGAAILYGQGPVCMAILDDTCLPPEHPYYQMTTNGLATLVQHYFDAMDALLATPAANITPNDPNFAFMYTVNEADLEGGMVALNAAFLAMVKGMYENTTMLHVVQFVLSVLLAGAFYIFMLRPFLRETSSESRRIAELLAQLPPELEVEGLVVKAIASVGPASALGGPMLSSLPGGPDLGGRPATSQMGEGLRGEPGAKPGALRGAASLAARFAQGRGTSQE